jgi:hypothetical protein
VSNDRPSEALPSLPRPAGDRVAESLEAAGLTGKDRDDVADELAAHLEDALASGRELSALLQEFGEPALTGRLIGRGVRRRRRSGHPMARVVWLFSLAVGLVYLAVFTRLHVGAPESSSQSPVETRDAVLAPWSPLAMPLAHSASQGEALGLARALARGSSPAGDLTALRIAIEIGSAACDARRSGEIAWRPEKVRAAFQRLLASMYTAREDGRLTAEGLRIYQAWKGKTHPSLSAVLLEPVYFPNPASRGEVGQEFERFLALAADSASPAFEDERRALASSPRRSLRLVALQIPLEHLAAVRQAARDLEANAACPGRRTE